MDIVELLQTVSNWVTALIILATAASRVADLTPTTRDNEIIDLILKGLESISLPLEKPFTQDK